MAPAPALAALEGSRTPPSHRPSETGTLLVGALQPGYLPWLGFFDQADRADLFLLYDDLPFDRRSWRQRNRIKTPLGPRWLSVPIRHAGQAPGAFTIMEAPIADDEPWARKHWEALHHCYAAAPHFAEHAPFFRELYAHPWTQLGPLTLEIIRYLAATLGIDTPIVRSSEIGLERAFRERGYTADRRTERIAFLVRELGGDAFLEGAAGEAYVRPEILERARVEIVYQRYRHPTYPQRFGDFVPFLSTVDLLFQCGPSSLEVIRRGRD